MTLAEIAKEICSLSSVLITTHISPDSDAVGSTGALALALQSRGKKALVYLADPLPYKMRNLAASVPITNEVPNERFDGLIVVDNAARRRIGPAAERVFGLAERTFNIDHHISNELFGSSNYVDSTSASASEIVFQLLQEMDLRVSREMANLMFAGLLEDTGCFRFSSVTSATFIHASQLEESGAQPAAVANELYFSLPLRIFKLRGLALPNIEFLFGGKVVMLFVPRQMLTEAGATSEDTEGLVDEIRSIEGTSAAVFVRQLDKGWKVSLRAKDESFDANAFAGRFGGGGHRAAAGATVAGSQDEVRAQLIGALKEHFKD